MGPAFLFWEDARAVEAPHVATSGACGRCHDGQGSANVLRDSAGRNISPHDLWQSSMMANSARDPLWRAVVSAEVQGTPAAAEAIESKCLRCHSPLASIDNEKAGVAAPTSATLPPGSDDLQLALDGVSCTVCHLMEPDGLGTSTTFSGAYPINSTRVIFGPHPNPITMPMANNIGYAVAEGDHIQESGVCATCHMVHVDPLNPDGTPVGGTTIEQATFQEWENSSYAADTSCQACHMPITSEDGVLIDTMIAHKPNGGDFPPVSARTPVARHLLVGGNTLVPQLLRDNAALLKPKAPASAFDATVAATRAQLAERTATVGIRSLTRTGTEVSFAVDLTSQVGHKLPSGIPTRRVWLRTQVTDAGGTVLFVSGGWNADGSLVDGNGVVLPSELAGGPVLPHVDQVQTAGQVPVWEGVASDATGAPTFSLLRAAGWYKDNRLLPTGWDATVATNLGIGPVGTAADTDFTGGADTVHFALPIATTGPVTVQVDLVYQPLSARFANELFTHDTEDIRTLQALLATASRVPEPVASASLTSD